MESEVKLYKNCPVVDYTSDGCKAYACDIRIEGKKMVLSYFNREHIIWEGTEEAPGHYVCRVKGEDVGGDATLHRFPKSNILEGYWTMNLGVNAIDGMWRITLKNPWREPKKGDWVVITTEDGELERCKITGVTKGHIKTKDFEDIPFSDYGDNWEYAKD